MTLFFMQSGSAVWSWLPPLMMVAGVIVLGVVATLLVRIAAKPKPTGEVEAEANRVLQQVHDARYQIEDARSRVAELIGTVQRLSIKLDDKAAKVNKLLASPPASPAPNATSINSQSAALDSPHRAATISVAVETKPSAESEVASAQAFEDQVEPLKKAIYDLADAGREPLEIAGQLNEHVGKVELILALRAM